MIIKSINNNLKREILSYLKFFEIQATTKTLPQPFNSHNQIPRPQFPIPISFSRRKEIILSTNIKRT